MAVEWTLYEEVAIAAMDCQCPDVAKVDPHSSLLLLTVDIWLSQILFSECLINIAVS